MTQYLFYNFFWKSIMTLLLILQRTVHQLLDYKQYVIYGFSNPSIYYSQGTRAQLPCSGIVFYQKLHICASHLNVDDILKIFFLKTYSLAEFISLRKYHREELFVFLSKNLYLEFRMISNLLYKNFWQLTLGWNFCKIHQNSRKDTVRRLPAIIIFQMCNQELIVQIYRFCIVQPTSITLLLLII